MSSTSSERSARSGRLQREPIVLASQSAVRAKLLRAAGLRIETRSSGIDEAEIFAGLSTDADLEPIMIAERLAAAKAAAAAQPSDVAVIAADQLLVVDGRVLQKAETMQEAHDRLWSMRAGSHQLITAAIVVSRGAIAWRGADVATVMMRSYSKEALAAYLAAAGPGVLSSVACYEIEGLGAQLIENIDGDYFSALGLPLLAVLEALRDVGAAAR